MKQLLTTYKAVCTLNNMCAESRRDAFLSRRRRARGINDGEGGKDEGPAGAAAAGTGSEDSADGGTDDNGAVAAGGPAPGGGGGAGGDVPAGAGASADPSPALNAIEEASVGGMVAVFDAWGETRNPTEHENLHADLAAHVWSDRGTLMASNAM